MTLNKQKKSESQRGIEWTDYTWNPVTGCQHACSWDMPDGSRAECYAKTIADKFRSPTFMPDGFEAHEFHPNRLDEPLKLKTPAKIFLDSFSDLMGHWVPDEQIEAVLDVCRRAHWHTFQLLTKNAPRLLKFDFPPNVWVGVSAPPSHMNGKVMTDDKRKRYVYKALDVFDQLTGVVRWMSIEPLSFDIAAVMSGQFAWQSLDWVVIGAASNGPRTYQPQAQWLTNLLELCDAGEIPVFFKGNLTNCPTAYPWREEFPSTPVSPVSSIP